MRPQEHHNKMQWRIKRDVRSNSSNDTRSSTLIREDRTTKTPAVETEKPRRENNKK